MPTDWERGFVAGYSAATKGAVHLDPIGDRVAPDPIPKKKKRKKSAWDRYVAQKKNQIKFKSGAKKGLLNMKKMGAEYRRKKKGRKR